jgi:hypothetical protein
LLSITNALYCRAVRLHLERSRIEDNILKKDNMKKILLSVSMILISMIVRGQNIEISIGPSINDLYNSPAITGLPNYKSKAGFSAGLHLTKSVEKKLTFRYGLIYQHSKIEVDPFIDPYYDPPPFNATADIFSIEIDANLNLKHNFYLCLGPTIDLQVANNPDNIESQTGIGLIVGFGKKIKLNNKLLLNIRPNFGLRNIITMEEKDALKLKLMTAGLNLGIIFCKTQE